MQISEVRGVVAATDTAYRHRRMRSRGCSGICIHRVVMKSPLRSQSRRRGESEDSKTDNNVSGHSRSSKT